MRVARLGATSCTFRYSFSRAEDGEHVATIDHVVVCSNLDTVKKVPMPQDVRTLLERHALTFSISPPAS